MGKARVDDRYDRSLWRNSVYVTELLWQLEISCVRRTGTLWTRAVGMCPNLRIGTTQPIDDQDVHNCAHVYLRCQGINYGGGCQTTFLFGVVIALPFREPLSHSDDPCPQGDW